MDSLANITMYLMKFQDVLQIKDAEQRLGLAVNLLENRLAPKQEVIETTDVMKDAEEGVVECDRHLRNLQRLHLPAHQ